MRVGPTGPPTNAVVVSNSASSVLVKSYAFSCEPCAFHSPGRTYETSAPRYFLNQKATPPVNAVPMPSSEQLAWLPHARDLGSEKPSMPAAPENARPSGTSDQRCAGFVGSNRPWRRSNRGGDTATSIDRVLTGLMRNRPGISLRLQFGSSALNAPPRCWMITRRRSEHVSTYKSPSISCWSFAASGMTTLATPSSLAAADATSVASRTTSTVVPAAALVTTTVWAD